jgi:hypothetical protein
MRRFLLPLFISLAATTLVFIILSAGALPERVASHFGRGGFANGWMTRGAYLGLVALGATVLPLMTAALLSTLPRAFPRLANIPNRDYWLAAERREATLAALDGFGWAFASLLTLFFAGMHWTILDANASVPPRLAEAPVHALVIGFSILLVAWVAALLLRFRRTSDRR